MKNTTPKCPICGKFIRLDLNEAPDRKMDQHITSGCTLHVWDKAKSRQHKKKETPRCALPGCRNKEGYELVRCKFCHRSFCLTHRHAEDHRCPRLEAKTKRYRPSEAERQRRSQAAQLKAVTKPKGSEKIPQERRFYVEVESKKGGATVCFDKTWTIGKCVDVACERLGVDNRNNDPSFPKTHLTSKKSGAVFPFDIPIHLLVPALSPGDTVILGPAKS
eukprot:CAMPEP_0167796888 /NCGR_PEP_ID=MMETSP0111_2-20121227/15322_1 /TAXON_ID=91324 /ORGANISM="Lotharella globosa, Strain CCCM811" /LENGTH=218 /DNA_ID=CAMNT_0007690879 /DNA_START=126 /DNA_END=782 /DNA_ORIENTATION=+